MGGTTRVHLLVPVALLLVALAGQLAWAQIGVNTVAGGVDGPALQAIISDSRGLALGKAGRIFFSDWTQNSVRTFFNSTNGSGELKVETLFGDLTQTTKAGNLSVASVFRPWGVAYDATKEVVYIAAHGTGQLLALSNFDPLKDTGSVSIIPLPVEFEPTDIEIKPNGNLLLVSNANDSGPKLIELNATSGVSTVLATGVLLPGRPEGVAFDPVTSEIYVADTQRHVVRVVPAGGALPRVLAGFEGSPGFSDGVGGVSLFNQPSGLSLVGDILYVADRVNNRLRSVNVRTAIVQTVAGSGVNSQVDGLGPVASFSSPRAVHAVAVPGAASPSVYSTDSDLTHLTGLIRVSKFNAQNQTEVTTLAGFNKRYIDGKGTDAKFGAPIDLAVDSRGNIIIADDGVIRSFDPVTRVTTSIVGTGSPSTPADGPLATARVGSITAIATGANDTLWFSDGERLRLLDFAAGNVTTFSDTFEDVGGMVLDPLNNVLYYTERGNRRVLAYDVATNSTRFVAGSGNNEDLDGVGEFAAFRDPRGITRSPNTGFLYVADTLSHKIKRIHPLTGVVQTVAGTGFPGAEDTLGISASFNQPTDITITASGDIFVTDQGNHRLRRFNESNVAVTTVTGSVRGIKDGSLEEALFDTPKAILVDTSRPQGLILYVTSLESRRVRRTVLVDPCTTGLVCADSNPCTLDRCDSGSAACFSTPLDKTPCDDSNQCTGDDTCDDGICRGTALPGFKCFDNSLCTTGDTCNEQGQCIGFPIECEAPNRCILSVCDPVQGCVNSAKVCNDSNPCTDDVCNSDVGCEFIPNALPCTQDADACTFDRCNNGTCTVGAPNSLNCDDNNICTVDSCNNVTGCINKGPDCPVNQFAAAPDCECQCDTTTPCPVPGTALDTSVCLCVTANSGAFRRIEVQYFTDMAVVSERDVNRRRNNIAAAAGLPAERLRVSSDSILPLEAKKKKREVLNHFPNRRLLLDVFAPNSTFSIDDMLAQLAQAAQCVNGIVNGICQVNSTTLLYAPGADVRFIIFNRIAVPFNPGEAPAVRPSPSFVPAASTVSFISFSPIRRPEDDLPVIARPVASSASALSSPPLLLALLALCTLVVSLVAML